MTELETMLIEGAVALIEKIVTAIMSSSSLTNAQRQTALSAIGSRLDATAAKVQAVKFKDI